MLSERISAVRLKAKNIFINIAKNKIKIINFFSPGDMSLNKDNLIKSD
jgi:hypothetical protein